MSLLVSPVSLNISYDPETEALYIRPLEGRHECRNVRLNDEVALNIGPNETLVGIEILDARRVFGRDGIPPLWPGIPTSLALAR